MPNELRVVGSRESEGNPEITGQNDHQRRANLSKAISLHEQGQTTVKIYKTPKFQVA